MLSRCDASYATLSRVGVGGMMMHEQSVVVGYVIEETAAQGREGRMFGKSQGKHGWSGWLVLHDTLTCVSSKSQWKHGEWGRGNREKHCQFVQHDILCFSSSITLSTFEIPSIRQCRRSRLRF